MLAVGCWVRGALEQDGETFLVEVPVVGQHLRDLHLAAHDHRHAVDQTVSLIRPQPVQRKRLVEELRCLADDGDILCRSNRFNQFQRASPQVRTSRSNVREDFHKDGVCCEHPQARGSIVEGPSLSPKIVVLQQESEVVRRIYEDSAHLWLLWGAIEVVVQVAGTVSRNRGQLLIRNSIANCDKALRQGQSALRFALSWSALWLRRLPCSFRDHRRSIAPAGCA